MFKRALMILLVLMVLFSFTSVAFAGQRAELNEDGTKLFLPDVVRENANEVSRAYNNPIDVAGE